MIPRQVCLLTKLTYLLFIMDETALLPLWYRLRSSRRDWPERRGCQTPPYQIICALWRCITLLSPTVPSFIPTRADVAFHSEPPGTFHFRSCFRPVRLVCVSASVHHRAYCQLSLWIVRTHVPLRTIVVPSATPPVYIFMFALWRSVAQCLRM